MVSVIYNRCATWLSDVHVLHCRWAFLNVPFLRAFKDIFCFPCSRSRGLHLWKIQDGWCLFRGVSHLPPSLPSFRLGLTAWTNQRAPFSYGFWLRLSNGEPGVGGSEEEKRGGWLGIYAQGSSAEWLRAPLSFLLKATAHLHFTQPVSMFLETCLPWPYSRFHQPKGKAQSFVAFFTPPKPLLIFPLLNTPQITHFDCTLFPVGIPTDKLIFYLVEEGHVWRRKWQIQHELRGGSGNWPSEDRLCLWTLGKIFMTAPQGPGHFNLMMAHLVPDHPCMSLPLHKGKDAVGCQRSIKESWGAFSWTSMDTGESYPALMCVQRLPSSPAAQPHPPLTSPARGANVLLWAVVWGRVWFHKAGTL